MGTLAPATLVGRGRVGEAVARMLGPSLELVVTRDTAIPEHPEGPIYCCVTNDALDSVADRTPPGRTADLVLLQNGWLLPWLRARGLLGKVTQVALYMAAGPDGTATDGKLTVVSGRWSAHVAATLARGGVSCREVDGAGLAAALVEKQLWACIFWMMSAALGGKQVGDIVQQHEGEVRLLVAELLPLLRTQLQQAAALMPGAEEAAMKLEDEDAVVASLVSYSLSIAGAVPSRDMALAEFRWRNGAVLGFGGRQQLHREWLARAGVPDELVEQYWACGGAGNG